MLGYVLRRLIWTPVILLAVIAITLTIFLVAPPIDPAILLAGRSPSPEAIQRIREQFGLDQPVWVQYGLFVGRLVGGDEYGWPGLGYSYTSRESVLALIGSRIGITLTLAIGAAVLWVAIGMVVGVIAAVKYNTIFDRLAMGFSVLAISISVLWLGPMLLYLFWFQLRILPGTGYVPISDGFWPWFSHMILPWTVLSLTYAAWYARMMRSTLLETLGEDYIRTARAKGVSSWRVTFRHGVRASLGPLVTMFGTDLGALIGGAIVVELIFNLQGVGQLMYTAIATGDLPVILAMTVLTAVAVMLCNLVVDIVRARLDPRVQLESTSVRA